MDYTSTDLKDLVAFATIAGYGWTYDAANRMTSFTNSQYAAEDATYTHDDLGQLTGADRTGAASDEGYAYDENGNRTGGGYATGANNRIESDGTFDYEFDAEGNLILITEISSGDYQELEWDHRNRVPLT